MKRLFYISCLFLCIASCKKDLSGQCDDFREAMAAKNIEKTRLILNRFIDRLESRTYSEENITKLSRSIKNECGIEVSSTCFDCIQTLPSQTEIILLFTHDGAAVQKVIDLTYSTDNRIVFGNIHD